MQLSQLQMHCSFHLRNGPRPHFRRSRASGAGSLPPVTFTADQDHQNMMDQLGIKTLRPGWSGNENAPNHANYDESKANPYPKCSGPVDAERRHKGRDRRRVVEAAPPRARRNAFEICLWLRARQCSQGHLDRHRRRSRDDRLHASDCKRSDWRSGQLSAARRSASRFI